MRSGNIIAIVVLVAVVIGGFVWYTARNNQTEIASQPAVQPADPVGDGETAQAPPEDADMAQTPDLTAVAPEGETGDAPIIVGDAITEDSIVVESETAEAVILDPETAAISVDMVTDDTSMGSAETALDPDLQNDATSGAASLATADPAAVPAGTATGETVTPATGVQDLDAAELLTPENFERDSVLALLAGSEQLSDQQRSSLSALVEGSVANPEMRDGAIALIRSELGLQPVD